MSTNVRRHYIGDEGARYYEKVVPKGVRQALWNDFLFAPYISEQDSVLDFGAGSGATLAILPARQKVALEVNPAADASLDAFGLPHVRSLPELAGQQFTRIISSHTLEHLTNPYSTLVELRQYLAPGGRLILLLPLDDYHNREQRGAIEYDDHQHLYAWTPRTLGNLLVAAGYRTRSVRAVTHAWPFHCDWRADLLWRMDPRLFHAAAWATAFLANRRQLHAMAELR